ncbi:MAG: hypothetical protein OXG16_05685 [Rhodospirillales bacterium]|nr:hypothetical protein [Rhodospirillales bacterium]
MKLRSGRRFQIVGPRLQKDSACPAIRDRDQTTSGLELLPDVFGSAYAHTFGAVMP